MSAFRNQQAKEAKQWLARDPNLDLSVYSCEQLFEMIDGFAVAVRPKPAIAVSHSDLEREQMRALYRDVPSAFWLEAWAA